MNVQATVYQDDEVWSPQHEPVTFKRTAPGGDIEAGFRITSGPMLHRLRAGARVELSDTQTGELLWMGFVRSPGRQGVGANIVCDVDVDGCAVQLGDQVRYRPYIVTRMSAWGRDDESQMMPRAADVSISTTDWNPPVSTVLLQVPQGQTISYMLSVRAKCYAFQGTGYYIGAVRARRGDGASSPQFRVTLAVGDMYVGTQNTCLVWDQLWAGAQASEMWRAQSPAFPSTKFPPYQQEVRVTLGATDQLNHTTSNADLWSAWDMLVLLAHRMDRDGHYLYMPYRTTAYAHEIIEDLIGRHLRGTIDTDLTVTEIDQGSAVEISSLDFSEDGCTDAELLDELVEQVGETHWWKATPGRKGSRQAALEWMPWSDRPRYQLPLGVTPDLRGDLTGLYNAFTCEGRTDAGRREMWTFVANPDEYPDTADLGDYDPAAYGYNSGWSRLVTAGPVDLTNTGTYMLVLFQRLKDLFFRRRLAGTAVVTGVMDLDEGRWIPARLIQPGFTAVSPETGDQVRVTSVEYDDATGVATLGLNSPTRSIEQVLTSARRTKTRR